MRKYDLVMAATSIIYLVMAMALYFFCGNAGSGENLSYKVEINEIMQGLESDGEFSEPDLRGKDYIKEVSFLPVESEEKAEIRDFYQNHNGVHTAVEPLVAGDELIGYVRFDYTTEKGCDVILRIMEAFLFIVWLLVLIMLWYIRQKILKPFNALSEMPYELAKGHLSVEPEENKSRFFGKFIWGIVMLRDTLDASKNKELKLEKEKKLLLLSISHDIKIPLSAIKLYAKALHERIYGTQEQERRAALQIEKHAQEIEEFVREIVSTASEDIFMIEVTDSEFYLKDYINKVIKIYESRCGLLMTDFIIGKYENKLLKGDIDRALEVMENLMENAFKYGDGKEIRISFYEEEGCQVIEVFNSGTAVDEKEMPHLFDSFYRGSNAGGKDGNGLGLYINRQIMLKMEGDIFAQKEAGGMRFGLVFRL